MGDEVIRSTLERWSEQGGAGAAPNRAPPPLPSWKEAVGGAEVERAKGGVEQNGSVTGLTDPPDFAAVAVNARARATPLPLLGGLLA